MICLQHVSQMWVYFWWKQWGLGADEVINYRTTRFEEVVKDYDVVLDTVTQEHHMSSYFFLISSFFCLRFAWVSYSILGCDSFGARLEHICSLFWRSICNGPCRPMCWKEVPKMTTTFFRNEKLGPHSPHRLVTSSMVSFIIHDSSICTQLIRMKWSHMKFQWFCHCSKSGGHYIHVVSSDWASNDQEANIVEMLMMPFLRHKLAAEIWYVSQLIWKWNPSWYVWCAETVPLVISFGSTSQATASHPSSCQEMGL